MDIAAMSMQMNLNSLQSAMSTSILDKAMNKDVQAMTTLLSDMMPAAPTHAGAMDIRV